MKIDNITKIIKANITKSINEEIKSLESQANTISKVLSIKILETIKHSKK